MHALQLTMPRSFSQVQLPEPQRSKGILVRLKWAIICGSDMVEFAGKRRSLRYPLPIGMPIHECVGEVVESTSEMFAPGDFVIAVPDNHQGLCELFVSQGDSAIHLPDALFDFDGSALVQPLSTVIYAADKLGDVAGHSVAVIGLGPIGQLFCWLLKLRGARSVVGIDPSAWRCEFAEQMGATKTFPMRGLELVQYVRHKPDFWEAPDIFIEAAGQQTETINDCIELVRHNGTVLAFGVPPQPLYPIEYEMLFRKNLHVIGSVAPHWRTFLPLASELVCQHHAELASLITHRFPVQDVQQAYTLYEQQGNSLKILLDASQW
ncbi:MAG TPA: zinc-binding dehydrogenase [Ktedonobacteraceae bacterium]|nr:zinc-binding dehydrogenase [Ktedonobacteraceae bacterium]